MIGKSRPSDKANRHKSLAGGFVGVKPLSQVSALDGGAWRSGRSSIRAMRLETPRRRASTNFIERRGLHAPPNVAAVAQPLSSRTSSVALIPPAVPFEAAGFEMLEIRECADRALEALAKPVFELTGERGDPFVPLAHRAGERRHVAVGPVIPLVGDLLDQAKRLRTVEQRDHGQVAAEKVLDAAALPVAVVLRLAET